MNPETWAQIGLASATAVASAFAGRAARRTRRQETRDDFTAIKNALNDRIDCLKADLDEQRELMGNQAEALGYVVGRVRSLVTYIRKAGLEPPTPPPIPERARDYLHHIDM